MRQINQYILEKLKINKDSKIEINKNFIPTAEDLNSARITLKYCDKDKFSFIEEFAGTIKGKNKIMRMWIATMLKTGSIPYIDGDTVNSLPGNFGRTYIDRLLKDKELTAENILEQYKNISKDINCEVDPHVTDYFNTEISIILNKVLPKDNYATQLKYDEYDNYGDLGIEQNKKRNGIITIPFDVIYGKYTVPCEISFLGYGYYNYRVNGKDYNWSNDWVDALKKELNIK